MSFLLHLGATVMCPHAGQATPAQGSARVFVGGQPAVNATHVFTIAACTFTTESPKPCATVQWTQTAQRVFVDSAPALLTTSTGVTLGPTGVQGTPQVLSSQQRVTGQ